MVGPELRPAGVLTGLLRRHVRRAGSVQLPRRVRRRELRGADLRREDRRAGSPPLIIVLFFIFYFIYLLLGRLFPERGVQRARSVQLPPRVGRGGV